MSDVREPSRRSAEPPDPRRRLPSVDRLLDSTPVRGWEERWGREPVRRALREALDAERRRLGAAMDRAAPSPPAPADLPTLLSDAGSRLRAAARPGLRRLLNGTGVILHTNLGRAPLAAEAMESLERVRGYCDLEYDLEAGGRGSRYDHCTDLLRRLTGAEAALVVNNNAAAVALAVSALASGREVVVSRGELVEIGGSFRLPDVILRAGGRLVEVGTTNRTRLADYRAALGRETGLILRVHPSNYRVQGFTARVRSEALVGLAREAGVPLAHDLGSGLLRSDLLPGVSGEPSVVDAVAEGADLVTYSGDKLLGGPQAGVLVGRAETVGRLRDDPLARAFRVDKMTLAALEATLLLHRDPERAAGRIPALRMLRSPVEEVLARARRAASLVRPGDARVEVVSTDSVVGGGSCPGHRIASAALAVSGADPEGLAARCRRSDPPLVGRIEEDRFLVDLRTLLPGEEAEAAAVLSAALSGG